MTVVQKTEDGFAAVAVDIANIQKQVGAAQLNNEVLLEQRLAFLRKRLAPTTQVNEQPFTPPDTTSSEVSSVLPKQLPSHALGMSAKDGQAITEHAHIRQSLSDIFRTAIGSRVMRRNYGSRLPDLIDAPTNDSTIMSIVHAASEAALKWEQRIEVLMVRVIERNSKGQLILGIAANDIAGNRVDFEVAT